MPPLALPARLRTWPTAPLAWPPTLPAALAAALAAAFADAPARSPTLPATVVAPVAAALAVPVACPWTEPTALARWLVPIAWTPSPALPLAEPSADELPARPIDWPRPLAPIAPLATLLTDPTSAVWGVIWGFNGGPSGHGVADRSSNVANDRAVAEQASVGSAAKHAAVSGVL